MSILFFITICTHTLTVNIVLLRNTPMTLGTVGRFYKKYGFSGDCTIYYFLGFILLNLLDVGDIGSADLLFIDGLSIITPTFILSPVCTLLSMRLSSLIDTPPGAGDVGNSVSSVPHWLQNLPFASMPSTVLLHLVQIFFIIF